MPKEGQSSLLQVAETVRKELTQRKELMISEVPSRTSRQTDYKEAEEEACLKRGNCRIWRS